MCLAVPGNIKTISDSAPLTRTGEVDFGGVTRPISLALVSDAHVGDWVLVHAGMAISIVDEQEAREVQRYLDEMLAERGDQEPEP